MEQTNALYVLDLDTHRTHGIPFVSSRFFAPVESCTKAITRRLAFEHP